MAHSLTSAEALRGYPVHLRGVVTYYDPFLDSRQTAVFVHDGSGSIYLGLHEPLKGLSAGTLVDVQGVSGMGDFAPVVAHARVRVLRMSQLPRTAPAMSLTHLLTGQEDGQWVEVEGIVHTLFETEHDISLQIAMRDGMVAAILPREPHAVYRTLVDSQIKVHANAAPIFNGDGQMVGARLLIPDLSAVRIIEPGPEDAFELPVRDISGLSRFSPTAALPRRIHVRGRVTLDWPGSLVCIRDEAHGLCAHTSQAAPLSIGEMVDAVGFLETDGTVPALGDTMFRPARGLPSEQAVVPAPVIPDQALHGKNSSELVVLEGQLIGRNLTSSDTTLLLASQGSVYTAVLPEAMSGAASGAWKKGSRLRVTGICSVQIDTQRSSRDGGAAFRKSFRVLLRSPQDVTVLEEPSWWTPIHTVLVLAIVLSGSLVALGWVVILTRRLRRQTRIIQDSEERFRHLAQHDALTGLPTRVLLRERLDTALATAKVSGTSLALLMLDLDNFKLINDSLGHYAGDQALKVAAQRMRETVRRSDIVARISGDEFVVLLDGLKEPKEAECIAAEVIAALSLPFRFGDRYVPLSASIGVCTAPGGKDHDADDLLKCVDAAMYQAKARGRNRFQLYTGNMAQSVQKNLKPTTELSDELTAHELAVAVA